MKNKTIKGKLYYICHYCNSYICHHRKDMVNHCSRKLKCPCNSLLSYDECSVLSLYKKFYFYFDIEHLTKDDIMYIVKNYINDDNHIYEDYKKYSISTNLKSNTYFKQLESLENMYLESDEEEDNNDEVDSIFNGDEFKKMYYYPKIDRYVCDKCMCQYKTKQNLLKHLNNEKQCKYKQNITTVMKKSKEYQLLKEQREKEEDEKFKQHLEEGYKIIQNINNTQNVNHTQNFNNNTLNNTYHLDLTDFVNERYDLSHIKDSFYQKKDFFIYPNFLRMIMENKKNQNIFFANNEAIIYTDNELNKMSSDKAGYLLLEKLSQSFQQLINQQDDRVRDYYSFVTKYYYVIKGHYKHDTIFKDYDVEEQKFTYTAQGNLFRSRDKYLSKMMTTVNHFSDDVRQNMNIKGDDVKNIPLINPNIEDYASIKMRYRDLRDKD